MNEQTPPKIPLTPFGEKRLPKTDEDIDLDLEIGDLMIEMNSSKATNESKLDSLGRMSAEAMTKQYEAAAKACESMGDEIRARIAMLQVSLDECARDMKLIGEAATAIRDKGKAVRAQIEKSSALSKQVRDACADLKRKVSVV